MAKSSRVPLQVQVLGLGLVFWALHPVPEWWALVLTYGAAWLVAQGLRRGLPIEGDAARWALTAVVVAAPLAVLWRWGPDFGQAEGLVGLGQWQTDRLRLEADPVIAPPLVLTDRPQTFYVRAGDAESVQVELGRGGPVLDGAPVGPGLFLVGYDPKVDGAPAGDRAKLEVAIVADGRRVERQVRRVDPEAHPRWFCSHPGAGLAVTPSEETDELLVVRRDGSLRRVETGDGPSDCAFFESDGRLLVAVSHRYSSFLTVFDAELRELARLEVGPFQGRLAVDPGGERLALALGGLRPGLAVVDLTVFDPANPEVAGVERVDLDFVPEWIAFGRNGDDLAISSREERTLSRYRRGAGGWAEDANLWLGRPVVTMAPSVTGDRIFVVATDYRPDGEDHRGNHFIQDQILTLDTESWRVTGQALTARRTERQQYPGGLDAGTSPMGLVHRADGTLLVAFAGSEEVWIVDDGFDLPPEVMRGADLFLISPHGVADLGGGVWAASSPAGGAVAVFEKRRMLFFHGVARHDDELAGGGVDSLGEQALALRRGERAFYETTRSGISCQSCHLHGESDASPHDIGQQPLLPTLTVRGIAGTSPYLRDGSFPRVRDLHYDLAEPLLRGYRRDAASRPQDLESFVESLPRRLHPEHWRWLQSRDQLDPLVDQLERGFALFQRAACETCHPAPAFTHLGAHPVRAIFPDYGESMSPEIKLDTPSLLGVGGKGHWLQDGRAASLEEVLVEENKANRHGDTAALTPAEIRVLADFLAVL